MGESDERTNMRQVEKRDSYMEWFRATFESAEDAGRRLGLSRDQVRRYCRSGRMDPPAYFEFGKWWVEREAVPVAAASGRGRPPTWAAG